MKPIEEVASALAAARAFVASVPAGDWRQDAASAVNEASDTVLRMLQRRVTPGSPEAAEWVLELRLLLANMSKLLVRIEAVELGERISRAADEVSERASRAAQASKGKRGQTALRAKALAEFRANGGSVRAFAKAFAARHGVSAETVRDWLRGKRGA